MAEEDLRPSHERTAKEKPTIHILLPMWTPYWDTFSCRRRKEAKRGLEHWRRTWILFSVGTWRGSEVQPMRVADEPSMYYFYSVFHVFKRKWALCGPDIMHIIATSTTVHSSSLWIHAWEEHTQQLECSMTAYVPSAQMLRLRQA